MDENKPQNREDTAAEPNTGQDNSQPKDASISVNKTHPDEKIVLREIEDEMKKSYLEYSMSVIVGRALPDVRDGLKPVHRRVLFSMHELGLVHNKAYKKCARIVGEVLGKYHPHGDTAVYDSLVRMAQNFSLRYPLVDGQGNFGCFTADTKVKLTDGRNLSFDELIKEHNQGKKNYTFTVNENNEIEIAEILNPRKTIENAELVKVTLDNSKEIRCTPNHKFMLKDGTYKEAKDLNPEESLMPLYTKISNEADTFNPTLQRCLLIHQPSSGKWMQSYQLAGEYNLKFDHFSQVVEKAELYNHKVIKVELLKTREDVYDLTINKTHNFALAAGVFVHNSVDGDNPAAMRYTEARLSKISAEMLTDIEKETVKFQPNFDASLDEPSVLPAKIPNLLINGSSGIAVGMATNIPPHNLHEVVDGVIRAIDNPEISSEELMESIIAPDFPTGGIICGRQGIINAYRYGRGKIIVRARTQIEEKKKRQSIIITEIPYMVNKSLLIEHIADLIRDKKVNGISDIRDESDRDGMRIVIELKTDANSDVVLNQLYKHSNLQTTFGVIMLALVNNIPKVLNLKELITNYIEFRKEIVTKRTKFELKKAQERVHILAGLIIALDDIDNVIKKIKASKDTQAATSVLISDFALSELQAKAILDMKLQRLASLEQQKIKDEHAELLKVISELESILASSQKLMGIIKKELHEISEKYSDKRKTQVADITLEESELDVEDLIEKEEMVITVTNAGYIKRTPVKLYKEQRRGGKGIIAATTKEEDFISAVFTASTHSYILFFTNKGRVYWLKTHEIPESSRQAKGKPIINLIQFAPDEKINAFIPVNEFDDKHYLILATKQGVVKKTNLIEYSNPRATGIIAVNLDENDELINAELTDGSRDIILATKNGNAVRFNEEDARAVGRTSRGVRGINLREDDEVISMVIASNEKFLLTITENGFGKRTAITEYNTINRGGLGVINIQCTERNGKVVAVKSVYEDNDLMLISKNGITIRMPVSGISSIGRNTQGVTLMKLDETDKVVAAAVIVKEDDEASITSHSENPPSQQSQDHQVQDSIQITNTQQNSN